MRRLPQIAGFATVVGRNGQTAAVIGRVLNSLGARIIRRDHGSRQAPVDRRESRLRAVVDAQLGVDTLDVVTRRLLGDEQLGGDLAVRPALRDESQDLDLPGGQPRRPGRPPRCPMPGRRQNGVHRLGVEASGARLLAQLIGSTVEDRARADPDVARAVGDTPPPPPAIGPARSTRAGEPRGKPDPSIRSSCWVAMDTTDSKPPTRLRIRPVRYGYIRSRSHSAVLSGLFFSQIWLDTPNLPRPCTRPARYRRVTSADGIRRCRAAAATRSRDTA